MNKRQIEYIIKAFLEAKIPEEIKYNQPNLIAIDSTLGGYCVRVLHGDKSINMQRVINREEKLQFSALINDSKGDNRTELILYYRLAILTEEVLMHYCSSKQ